MSLVARASRTVRNKNLLIILLFVVFTGWFAYDGFVGYLDANDRFVSRMLNVELPQSRVDDSFRPELEAWKGWRKESDASRARMNEIVKSPLNRMDHSAWKSPFDIAFQRGIVYLLIAGTLATLAWFFHCQKRRAMADETSVSPSRGVTIPWERIIRVDNRRWKSTGIVEITYSNRNGQPQKARFDDYQLEREPLLAILEQLAQKAVNADFVPHEEPEVPAV